MFVYDSSVGTAPMIATQMTIALGMRPYPLSNRHISPVFKFFYFDIFNSCDCFNGTHAIVSQSGKDRKRHLIFIDIFCLDKGARAQAPVDGDTQWDTGGQRQPSVSSKHGRFPLVFSSTSLAYGLRPRDPACVSYVPTVSAIESIQR